MIGRLWEAFWVGFIRLMWRMDHAIQHRKGKRQYISNVDLMERIARNQQRSQNESNVS